MKQKINRRTKRFRKNKVKKRRNKSRNKTKKKRKTKKKLSNKIIHKQSGGILLEYNIIKLIPDEYKYDLDSSAEEISRYSSTSEAQEQIRANTIAFSKEMAENLSKITAALPLFNEKISKSVPLSVGKCKVYIIFTFFGITGFKLLHPIIGITGEEGSTDISVTNSTYEFTAMNDKEGTGVVPKGNGIRWQQDRSALSTTERVFSPVYKVNSDGFIHWGRLGLDKVRVLGFVGYFMDDSAASQFKEKLDSDFHLNPRTPNYGFLDNNCQDYVNKVLEDLKNEDTFIPAIIGSNKTMLDLDIIQGYWVRNLGIPRSLGIGGSVISGSVTSSVAGSVASTTPVAAPVVASAAVFGGAAGSRIGRYLESGLKIGGANSSDAAQTQEAPADAPAETAVLATAEPATEGSAARDSPEELTQEDIPPLPPRPPPTGQSPKEWRRYNSSEEHIMDLLNRLQIAESAVSTHTKRKGKKTILSGSE